MGRLDRCQNVLTNYRNSFFPLLFVYKLTVECNVTCQLQTRLLYYMLHINKNTRNFVNVEICCYLYIKSNYLSFQCSVQQKIQVDGQEKNIGDVLYSEDNKN